MRWKLLRRRLSISAPRMIVRSHLPWPLRWAVLALMLGFSAALALWVFEFGREIAGLDRHDPVERTDLQVELQPGDETRRKSGYLKRGNRRCARKGHDRHGPQVRFYSQEGRYDQKDAAEVARFSFHSGRLEQ